MLESFFYNLGVKTQARKLKFGMRDVIIELSDMYSFFIIKKWIYDSFF